MATTRPTNRYQSHVHRQAEQRRIAAEDAMRAVLAPGTPSTVRLGLAVRLLEQAADLLTGDQQAYLRAVLAGAGKLPVTRPPCSPQVG